MLHFVYEILGRGDVIYAQTLQAHKGTTHVFRFVATPSMAPRARLVVYYVREDGEIVADSLHFALDGAIQNEVSISVNPMQVDAGGEVAITVTTKPNAFVGISAIDQSSLLLSKRNDINEDGILQELESYDPGRIDAPKPLALLTEQKKTFLVQLSRNELQLQTFSKMLASSFSPMV
ncbi:C3 and PZP-like alpha-2-macroglobulin domain-containing protein 8 [Armadillidium vulgare]|nr:C3 and PZP-like alpha-2-macroglobulin domain-containing protein 8 [Armadillidium vulgare]